MRNKKKIIIIQGIKKKRNKEGNQWRRRIKNAN